VCVIRTRRYHRPLIRSAGPQAAAAGGAAMQGYRAPQSFVVDFDQSVSSYLMMKHLVKSLCCYNLNIVHEKFFNSTILFVLIECTTVCIVTVCYHCSLDYSVKSVGLFIMFIALFQ
jgi:hypothetical protein